MSTLKRLKVDMIGCGRIAEMYKVVFQQLTDYIEVAYAVDVKEERVESFASNFQGCMALNDYKECLQNNLDVIHIATPHYLHPVIAIATMKKGINVLTEKPMAISLKDADEMIRVAEENNVELGVIFQTRYVKGCVKLKEIIAKGKLGQLRSARSYLSWSKLDDYYLNSGWKGTWDKEGIYLNLYGDKAGAQMDPEIEYYEEKNHYFTNVKPIVDPDVFSFGYKFNKEIEHFIDCVQNKKECLNPAKDGLMIMKIIDAVYESARIGHEVIIK